MLWLEACCRILRGEMVKEQVGLFLQRRLCRSEGICLRAVCVRSVLATLRYVSVCSLSIMLYTQSLFMCSRTCIRSFGWSAKSPASVGVYA